MYLHVDYKNTSRCRKFTIILCYFVLDIDGDKHAGRLKRLTSLQHGTNGRHTLEMPSTEKSVKRIRDHCQQL